MKFIKSKYKLTTSDKHLKSIMKIRTSKGGHSRNVILDS